MSKIFYGLGGIAAVLGVILLISGHGIMGVISLVSGAVIMLATLFATKLIDAGSQGNIVSGQDGNLSVEMKINQAISGARQNKFKAENESRRLTAWSNDAIFTAYHQEYEKVGANYQKDALLDNYNEIREKYGTSLSFETMEKCDGIVKDYAQKIEGYKSRIDVFDKQELEYTELKNKIKAVKQHEKMMNKLQAHKSKIEAASEREAASIVAGDYDMAHLTMDSIAKEVSEKEEYFRQLDKINYQLGS